jgi:preprotein translocase subunit YajC
MELLFPLLLVALLVPMFLGVRRQRREAEKVNTMQAALKVGDRVTTTSGLYGTVVDVDDATVDLEIAEDVVTTWLRAAVRDIRAEEPAAVEDEPAEEDTGDSPALEAGQAEDATDETGTAGTNGVAGPAGGTAAGDAADDPERLTKE